jgi:hypothetical protein
MDDHHFSYITKLIIKNFKIKKKEERKKEKKKTLPIT